MGSKILYLKEVEWCVVLQARDKFEVDWHADSVSLRLKDDRDSLNLFESILKKDKHADFCGKYGRRCNK